MTTKQDALTLLKAVIKVPSVASRESEVAALLLDFLEPEITAGLITVTTLEYAPGRDSVILTAGNRKATRWLGIDGHMDVVDAGDFEKWHFPPFAATEEDGKIYGRGSNDMKAGLIAAVVALKKAAHASLTIGLQLMATVGEEIDNYGARQIAAQVRHTHLNGLLVVEPSAGMIQTAERGIIDYTVQVRGKAAHSSRPDLGANAIHGLLQVSQSLLTATALLEAQSDPLLGHATHNIDVISGGNQINSIPESAFLRGNIRTTQLADNDAFIVALKKAVIAEPTPGTSATLTIDSTLPAVATPADNPLVYATKEALVQHRGQHVPTGFSTGISDAALLWQPGMDLAMYGPGNDSSHTTDEYVEIADFLAAIDVFYTVYTTY